MTLDPEFSIGVTPSSGNAVVVVRGVLDSATAPRLRNALDDLVDQEDNRPLWRRQRNARGEIDEVFDGYGLLTATGVVRLGDGELSSA